MRWQYSPIARPQPSSQARRSRRSGSYLIPCENRRPFIRFTCATRSAIKTLRSREIRRRSSSSGVGIRTIAQKGTLLKAGSYFLNLPKHAHYGWTTDDGAVVQVEAIGPAGIDYINLADDPREK